MSGLPYQLLCPPPEAVPDTSGDLSPTLLENNFPMIWGLVRVDEHLGARGKGRKKLTYLDAESAKTEKC